MIGTSIAHYRVTGKLGEGGMGVVYRARDTRLDRDVAIKILPAGLIDREEEKARFVREAKAASSLNHPAVCTVYGIEDHEGSPAIVMEFVEGETLRDLAGRSAAGSGAGGTGSAGGNATPLPVERALAIALQIADGLASAHARGIVHRDVKSENVMITADGRVKIMDFGLARLKDSARLTRTATTVGTLPYMSPEQLRGSDATASSDLFSFGVVLYELLTGRLPFQGGHEAATMYKILNEGPEPMRKYRDDVPPAVASIVLKAIEKDPKDRHESMTALFAALRDAAAGIAGGAKRNDSAASIAVLAFEDMSPQRDQEYFCEGLAEEIINSLTQIRSLRVTSRTSAFSFKGKQSDVRELGRKLNVHHVLEGSVRKAGDRLRVTAQLVTVEDGYHRWSERYDAQLKDVFEVQDDITSKIVKALKVVLSPEERGTLGKENKVNVEAYDFYLRGRKLTHVQMREAHARAIEMFRRATQLEPRYALAYAGIADCYAFIYNYWESTDENRRLAEESSRKAMELDPELAEARVSHGHILTLSRRFEEAEKEFDIAIRLNPRLFEAFYYYARALFIQGKFEKAAKLYEEAAAIDPEDYQSMLLVTSSYRSLNQPEKVREAQIEGVRRAERRLDIQPGELRALYLGAGALVELGERDRAFEWVGRAMAIGKNDPGALYNIACVYASAGDAEKSIACLEQAVANGFSQREWIEQDSDLDIIRSDPRFPALLSRLK